MEEMRVSSIELAHRISPRFPYRLAFRIYDYIDISGDSHRHYEETVYMRRIVISGDRLTTPVPSGFLVASRPAVRAANHKFAPSLYTKDGANFFSLSPARLSDKASRLCGANVCPAGVVVLDDVAVGELVDALVLGEVENRAGVGDDAVAAGVSVRAGVEDEVVPAGLLDLLVEGVGDIVDVVAVGVATPDVNPAGAVGGESADKLGLGGVLDGHCGIPFIGFFLSTSIE